MSAPKAVITQNELYALADNLQMEIVKQGKSLTGSKTGSLKFGDMRLAIDQEVVSSAILEPGGGVVICRFAGDLGLMLIVAYRRAIGVLLDLAELSDKRGTGFLEAGKVKTAETALLMVEKAAVAKFRRDGQLPWEAMP